jgi:hypothetical protein
MGSNQEVIPTAVAWAHRATSSPNSSPSEQYKTQQMEMVEKLIAGGVSPEKVAAMFSIPFNLLLGEKQKTEKP